MDRRAFLAGGVVLSAMTAARIARAADRKLAVTHYGSLAYGIPVGAAWRAGYFDATGARLDGLLTADGGGTAVRNTLASDLPVGESGLYAIMAARRSGLDLVVIYQAINTAADVSWVVRADSPIKTLQDLAGKTITFTQPKSGSETQIREILGRTGLIDKVQLQASGGIREGLSMVEAGAAAAAPIVEPLRTALSSRFRSVVNADDYISRSAQIVGFTTRAFADSNVDMLKALVAARARGVDLTYREPATAARLVAPDYRMEPEALEKSIRALSQHQFWDRGGLNLDDFRAAEPIMASIGVTDGNPLDWPRILDARFKPPANTE